MFNKNSWIGDTGASYFITYNNTNMYNVKKINKQIVGILGNMMATKLEKILGWVKQVDSTKTSVEMYPGKYCPRVMENLFSITTNLSNSSKLQSNDTNNIHFA